MGVTAKVSECDLAVAHLFALLPMSFANVPKLMCRRLVTASGGIAPRHLAVTAASGLYDNVMLIYKRGACATFGDPNTPREDPQLWTPTAAKCPAFNCPAASFQFPAMSVVFIHNSHFSDRINIIRDFTAG